MRITLKLIIKRFFALFLVFIIFFFLNTYKVAATDDVKNRVKVVVIDPGHGGKDPGALGKLSKEKDIVLAISLKLKKYIEDNLQDVKVVMTREKDQFVPLHERADIANEIKADLFISIHANANAKVTAYGAETYAMGLHANELNLEVAKKENSVITLEEDYKAEYEGFDPNSAESYIIFNLMQNTYLNQSLSFASYVQGEIEEKAQRHNRGVKQAGFLVLWRTSMPSVLVEAGFITNAEEEKYLISTEGQDSIAKCIYHAFYEYKKTIESQSMFEDSNDLPSNKEKVENEVGKSDDVKHLKDATRLSRRNIRFKVQVLVSSKQIPVKSEFFKGLDDVEEFPMSNIYKYAVGNKYTYDEISEYSQVVKQHFPDAFIIAIKNKKIIPVSQALEEINKQ